MSSIDTGIDTRRDIAGRVYKSFSFFSERFVA